MNESITYQTSTDTTLTERVRRLEFAGLHTAALALLDAQAKLSPQLEAARGTLLIFTGDRPRARTALTNALARGYRPALAALSSLQRLEGEPRDALLELSERDIEACDDFERANLEREVGLLHEERDALGDARLWLERAWRTAQLGTFGQYQLAGIAQALGRVLGRLGYDALAVSVFDEGLRHARADRRVPLLYERSLRHINLGLLEAAVDDLEELRVFVPNQPDLALLTRYAEARLQHALGDFSARTNFELALCFAASQGSPVAREVVLYSLLWLVRLDTDAGTLAGVPARLERAAGLVRGSFEGAWLTLRRARFISSRGDHNEAAELLRELPDVFLALGSRREAGIARLHRAEALMSAGTDRLEEADCELRRAADLARDLGGARVFHNELMALRKVQWHLEITQGWADGRTLLEAGIGVTRVRVNGHPLERGEGAEIRLPANAARLASYLVAHPCSSWAHLRWGVYQDVQDEDKALEMFDAARIELEAVRGMRVIYRSERHAYSLVWEGVSLER